MKWNKLPGIESKDVHQGCLCCPTPTTVANLNKGIAVGFGSAVCTRDGEEYYDGEAALQRDEEPKTIGDMEAAAKLDPDHDWQICFHAPLHGETYQRHGDDTWVMIESNMGFA